MSVYSKQGEVGWGRCNGTFRLRGRGKMCIGGVRRVGMYFVYTLLNSSC